jgi:uncharacterized membrane protein YfcA
VNRASIPNVWRRVLPIVIALAPGVMVGTTLVALVNPDWLKLITYFTLLPADPAAGRGFPSSDSIRAGGRIRVRRRPWCAVFDDDDFRSAARGGLEQSGVREAGIPRRARLIRLAESSMTAVAYAYVGLYSTSSMALIPQIVPSLAIGVPFGAKLIRRLNAETFRRICMSFDAWVVASDWRD